MESEFSSMAFPAHDVFKHQLRINKTLLTIIKSLTGHPEVKKHKDWI